MMWKAEFLIVKGEWDMKKEINVVLSCLTCIGLLVCSGLPVQAMGPDTCTHPYFALTDDLVPTGEYEYQESGHYLVWGIAHVCLKCGYEYFTDQLLVWDSNHEWEDTPSHVTVLENLIMKSFDCKTGDCPHQRFDLSAIM